jgi:hypothetical protein
MSTSDPAAPAADAKPRASAKVVTPKFIRIDDERGFDSFRQGRILKGDPDLIAKFDQAGIAWSEVSEEQRRLGGCVD